MDASGRMRARVAARRSITRSCAGDLPPLDLLQQIAERVRVAMPYVSAGWQLTDPATLLGTGGFAENVDRGTHPRPIENELTGADFTPFTLLAHSPAAVRSLRDATGREPERSTRYRTINAANGWGDDLRAVSAPAARRGGRCAWPVQRVDRPSARTTARSAPRSAGRSGTGLRTALLRDGATPAAPSRAPGLVVLQDDGSVEAMSDDASAWLAELPDEGLELPSVVYEVARRARSLAETGRPGLPARARVRVPSQHWLVLHGPGCARLHPGAPPPPSSPSPPTAPSSCRSSWRPTS